MPDPTPPSLDALWAHLTQGGLIRRLLQLARDEDLGATAGPGDITSRVSVPADEISEAQLVFRQPGTLAGIRAVPMLIEVFGAAERVHFEARAADGQSLEPNTTSAILRGHTRDILAVERTLLNLIARLSGIATRTARFVKLIEGTRAAVFDTRKTTPGLRNLEKYAVRCGGGRSHRLGLFDAVLIKDNHLAHVPVDQLAHVVSAAVAKARAIAAEHHQKLTFVECEVDTLDQFRAILANGGCGLDVILLDNMTVSQLREAVRLRDLSQLKLQLEASGGINEQTIRAIAETGIDRISIGGLTHQAVSLDIGLDFG